MLDPNKQTNKSKIISYMKKMNSPLCWRYSFENDYEVKQILKVYPKYCAAAYGSTRFLDYNERRMMRILKNLKIMRCYTGIIKVCVGFYVARRHQSHRKDLRCFKKDLILTEGFFQNLSQAAIINRSKQMILQDKPHTRKSIPISCESYSISLSFSTTRLIGATQVSATLKTLHEISELPRLKKLVSNYKVNDLSDGLDLMQCFVFFLKRILPRLEHYEGQNYRLGTAFALLDRKPKLEKLRILGLVFRIIFDMGQELRDLRHLIATMINLSVLKLEFSGDASNINYQFTELVNLTTEQKIESLKFIHDLRSTMKKSQELTGYSILSKNLANWNNRLQAYTRLRNLELTYEFAPYGLFHNNNSFEYFRFSKLQSLERLKLLFNFHHNSEVNQKLLYSVASEISFVKKLREFILISNNYLTDVELTQILQMLGNSSLENLNILTGNDYDINSNDFFKGEPNVLSSLTLGWIFTDEEKTQTVFEYISTCQMVAQLEIRVIFSKMNSNTSRNHLNSLTNLSNLKSFKFSSDNESLFNTEAIESIKKISESSQNLETLSLTLFNTIKNPKEIKSCPLKYEFIQGLLNHLCHQRESLDRKSVV